MKNVIGKIFGAVYGLAGSIAGGLNLAYHVDLFANKSYKSMSQVAGELSTPTEQIINILTWPAQVPSRLYEYFSGYNILSNAPIEAGLSTIAAAGLGCLTGSLVQDGIRSIRGKNSPLEL
jgi:hypothetical protein